MMDEGMGVMGVMMLFLMLFAAGVLIAGALGGGRVIAGLRNRASQLPAPQLRPEVEQPAAGPSALEQAKERYARGEIDHAELDRLLDVLLGNDQRSGRGR
ncbi:MAG TPA: SHOCT domain-containing protein [Jiangellaceae bacterium]